MRGCVLGRRTHLPGTQVTGKEMVRLLPATSEQECVLPVGTSCPPAPGSPETPPALAHPWGFRLTSGLPSQRASVILGQWERLSLTNHRRREGWKGTPKRLRATPKSDLSNTDSEIQIWVNGLILLIQHRRQHSVRSGAGLTPLETGLRHFPAG